LKIPIRGRRTWLFYKTEYSAMIGGVLTSVICNLKWEWEVRVSEVKIGSVFIIPQDLVKNGEERLVVLNRMASAVIERQRGKHSEFVFVYRGRPLHHMLNNGWRKARETVGLGVRVHDLKHTYGRRLRSAGVSFEDRQDLLGHKSARITTHYSSAELLNLWDAANKVCVDQNRPMLTLLRSSAQLGHAKVAQGLLGR
jgi:integrase